MNTAEVVAEGLPRKSRMVSGVGSHSFADRGDDFYATPPEAVASLLAIEAKWLPSGTVWEPACGDGAIVLPLRRAGFQVLATDLVDRGCPGQGTLNFLEVSHFQPAEGVASVITNPPFKLAREFVEASLSHAPYVAMLLRLAFLEGNARRPWFQSGSLARVHVSSRRLPMMHRDGWQGPKAGSAVAHAWFIWDKRHEGRPQVQWFDWKDYPVAANDNGLRLAA